MKHYQITESDVKRFNTKCSRSANEEGCILWNGAIRNGYGVFSLRGEKLSAHRVSVLISGREVPDGMDVCHHCDVPRCVNPRHLFVGTRSENMLDAFSKRRCVPKRTPSPLDSMSDKEIVEIIEKHGSVRSAFQAMKTSQVVLSRRLKLAGYKVVGMGRGKKWIKDV